MNPLALIPVDLNYTLSYRGPTGYLIQMSYGVPGRSKNGTISAHGRTLQEAVIRALGRPLCPSCKRDVIFEPEADFAFCQSCLEYPLVSALTWEHVESLLTAFKETA